MPAHQIGAKVCRLRVKTRWGSTHDKFMPILKLNQYRHE